MTNQKPDTDEAEDSETLLANFATKKKYRQVKPDYTIPCLFLVYLSSLILFSFYLAWLAVGLFIGIQRFQCRVSQRFVYSGYTHRCKNQKQQ